MTLVSQISSASEHDRDAFDFSENEAESEDRKHYVFSLIKNNASDELKKHLEVNKANIDLTKAFNE